MYKVEGNMHIVEIRLNELRNQIAKFRQLKPEFNHDCTQIEIMLREYIPKFAARHNDRYLCYMRKSITNMHSNIAMVEHYPLPIFFIDNQPVVKLALYNLYADAKKADLREYLTFKGASDFKIVSLLKKGKEGLFAIICCSTFRAACKLQCMSCAFELDHKLREGNNYAIKYMKIKPFMNLERPVVPELPEPSVFLREILKRPPILQCIADFAHPNDFYNFYIALNRNANFKGITADFKYDKNIYDTPNKRALILRDAEILRFTTIIFDCEEDTILPPFIVKFFKNCIQTHNVEKGAKIDIKHINLKGIRITGEVMELIRKHIRVGSFVIGEYDFAEELNLACDEPYEFAVANNLHIKLKILTHEKFANLTFLTLDNCSKLKMKFLCNFVRKNEILEDLTIIDCSQIDDDCRIGEIIEKIWSGTCHLKAFSYYYSEKLEHRKLDYVHRPTLIENRFIKRINFNNNTYVANYISEIIYRSRELREVKLIGLGDQIQVNIARLRRIHTLHLDYDEYFLRLMSVLQHRPMKSIFANNSRGKRSTMPIRLEPIFKMIRRSRDFSFTLNGVVRVQKYWLLDDLREKCNVEEEKNALTITYRR